MASSLFSQSDFEKQADEILKHRKGKLITINYLGTDRHYKWKCKNNHEWEATFSNIKKGKWCPYCAKNKVYPHEAIQKAREFAAKNKGELLSPNYLGRHGLHKWKCENNHEWEATYGSVVGNGSWCGICKGTARSNEEQLKKAFEIAHQKNGQCLTKKYNNIRSIFKWTCVRGHVWNAEYSSVVYSNVWCP